MKLGCQHVLNVKEVVAAFNQPCLRTFVWTFVSSSIRDACVQSTRSRARRGPASATSRTAARAGWRGGSTRRATPRTTPTISTAPTSSWPPPASRYPASLILKVSARFRKTTKFCSSPHIERHTLPICQLSSRS